MAYKYHVLNQSALPIMAHWDKRGVQLTNFSPYPYLLPYNPRQIVSAIAPLNGPHNHLTHTTSPPFPIHYPLLLAGHLVPCSAPPRVTPTGHHRVATSVITQMYRLTLDVAGHARAATHNPTSRQIPSPPPPHCTTPGAPWPPTSATSRAQGQR